MERDSELNKKMHVLSFLKFKEKNFNYRNIKIHSTDYFNSQSDFTPVLNKLKHTYAINKLDPIYKNHLDSAYNKYFSLKKKIIKMESNSFFLDQKDLINSYDPKYAKVKTKKQKKRKITAPVELNLLNTLPESCESLYEKVERILNHKDERWIKYRTYSTRNFLSEWKMYDREFFSHISSESEITNRKRSYVQDIVDNRREEVIDLNNAKTDEDFHVDTLKDPRYEVKYSGRIAAYPTRKYHDYFGEILEYIPTRSNLTVIGMSDLDKKFSPWKGFSITNRDIPTRKWNYGYRIHKHHNFLKNVQSSLTYRNEKLLLSGPFNYKKHGKTFRINKWQKEPTFFYKTEKHAKYIQSLNFLENHSEHWKNCDFKTVKQIPDSIFNLVEKIPIRKPPKDYSDYEPIKIFKNKRVFIKPLDIPWNEEILKEEESHLKHLNLRNEKVLNTLTTRGLEMPIHEVITSIHQAEHDKKIEPERRKLEHDKKLFLQAKKLAEDKILKAKKLAEQKLLRARILEAEKKRRQQMKFGKKRSFIREDKPRKYTEEEAADKLQEWAAATVLQLKEIEKRLADEQKESAKREKELLKELNISINSRMWRQLEQILPQMRLPHIYRAQQSVYFHGEWGLWFLSHNFIRKAMKPLLGEKKIFSEKLKKPYTKRTDTDFAIRWLCLEEIDSTLRNTDNLFEIMRALAIKDVYEIREGRPQRCMPPDVRVFPVNPWAQQTDHLDGLVWRIKGSYAWAEYCIRKFRDANKAYELARPKRFPEGVLKKFEEGRKYRKNTVRWRDRFDTKHRDADFTYENEKWAVKAERAHDIKDTLYYHFKYDRNAHKNYKKFLDDRMQKKASLFNNYRSRYMKLNFNSRNEKYNYYTKNYKKNESIKTFTDVINLIKVKYYWVVKEMLHEGNPNRIPRFVYKKIESIIDKPLMVNYFKVFQYKFHSFMMNWSSFYTQYFSTPSFFLYNKIVLNCTDRLLMWFIKLLNNTWLLSIWRENMLYSKYNFMNEFFKNKLKFFNINNIFIINQFKTIIYNSLMKVVFGVVTLFSFCYNSIYFYVQDFFLINYFKIEEILSIFF